MTVSPKEDRSSIQDLKMRGWSNQQQYSLDCGKQVAASCQLRQTLEVLVRLRTEPEGGPCFPNSACGG